MFGVLHGARGRTKPVPLKSDRQVSCSVKCTATMCLGEWSGPPVDGEEVGGGYGDLAGFVDCDPGLFMTRRFLRAELWKIDEAAC